MIRNLPFPLEIEDATALMSELKELFDKIKVLDKQVAEAEANLKIGRAHV